MQSIIEIHPLPPKYKGSLVYGTVNLFEHTLTLSRQVELIVNPKIVGILSGRYIVKTMKIPEIFKQFHPGVQSYYLIYTDSVVGLHKYLGYKEWFKRKTILIYAWITNIMVNYLNSKGEDMDLSEAYEYEIEEIKAETEKAWLIDLCYIDEPRWLPKSQCRIIGESLYIPKWLAESSDIPLKMAVNFKLKS